MSLPDDVQPHGMVVTNDLLATAGLPEFRDPRPDLCGEFLTEEGWEEGYDCTLPDGHDGPHRMESGVNEILESIDNRGRRYTWAYEWKYEDEEGSRK